MREEYTRDNYPSFGKKYSGERGVISLTSWKARIDTVSKTLYSLLKQCPGFHIVLVLSEEEFPKMMDELPSNLKLFVKNNLIEVLWVYKNYKAFKKILFTMDKYRNVPIISADDDCYYKCNYANDLLEEWEKNKSSVIRYQGTNTMSSNHAVSGPWTIYPPFEKFGVFAIHELLKMNQEKINRSLDDDFYNAIIRKYKIKHHGIKSGGYKNRLTFFSQDHAIHKGAFK